MHVLLAVVVEVVPVAPQLVIVLRQVVLHVYDDAVPIEHCTLQSEAVADAVQVVEDDVDVLLDSVEDPPSLLLIISGVPSCERVKLGRLGKFIVGNVNSEQNMKQDPPPPPI